ncbi:hypothetical protein GCM10027598_07540 [Amycolatopsis oliviviridis]|uniref:Uncharacterized protein n=1 Tax=Amycolatopsis oliviviridis TaxID=1471590 RepID=A0ABQ3LR36_9PSEU|nr:hypothetical protein [Amycolatopsis oliviviridis]GHH20721.1 hypothetical protein GCM10017790_40940 [Amycolatopsis oliviviridis]
MTTETNTAPVDDEATATEDLEETQKPGPVTAPAPTPTRTGVRPDGNWEPNGTKPPVN